MVIYHKTLTFYSSPSPSLLTLELPLTPSSLSPENPPSSLRLLLRSSPSRRRTATAAVVNGGRDGCSIVVSFILLILPSSSSPKTNNTTMSSFCFRRFPATSRRTTAGEVSLAISFVLQAISSFQSRFLTSSFFLCYLFFATHHNGYFR